MNLLGRLLKFMNSYIGKLFESENIYFCFAILFITGSFFGIITSILGIDIHVALILTYISVIVFSYYVEGRSSDLLFASVLGISISFYLLYLLFGF